MAYDVYVYGIKRGDDSLLAHGGHINNELWDERPLRYGRPAELVGSPMRELAALIKRIDGLDPLLAKRAIEEAIKTLPVEKRWLRPNLDDLWLACEHWNKLKNHKVHGVLYDTARIVVVSS